MDKETPTAHARVTVQLEIKVSSKWGKDCSIEQVHEQASSEALGMIRNLDKRSPPAQIEKFADSIRVLGDPVVTAIIVTK